MNIEGRSDSPFETVAVDTYLEIMIITSGEYFESWLTCFKRDTVFDSWAEHEGRAVDEIVHDVF